MATTSDDRISVDGRLISPKFTKASVGASATDSAIVAAVTGKKIRVLALFSICGGTATTITFNTKPGGAGTAISAVFSPAINGFVELGYSPVGWFETNQGEGLSATTGAGSTTAIQLVYAEV